MLCFHSTATEYLEGPSEYDVGGLGYWKLWITLCLTNSLLELTLALCPCFLGALLYKNAKEQSTDGEEKDSGAESGITLTPYENVYLEHDHSLVAFIHEDSNILADPTSGIITHIRHISEVCFCMSNNVLCVRLCVCDGYCI